MFKLALFVIAEVALSVAGTIFYVWLRESTRDDVYVTPSGKLYHRLDCTHLRGAFEKLPREEAIHRGLKACERCGV